MAHNTQIFATIEHLRNNEGLSWQAIGKVVGKDRRTVKKIYETTYTAKQMKLIPEGEHWDLSRFEPLYMKGNMLVTCDWHVPLHDPKMVNHLIRQAHKHDIKQLVIGGDFWNMDTFSHYLPHQIDASFDVERKKGREIFEALFDTFDNISFFLGNHDFRIARYLDFKLSFTYLMEWLVEGLEGAEKLTVSDLDYMYLQPGCGRTYRFSHQKSFSKIPLTVPRQLAMKHHCSIITAHSHHFAMGFGIDGYNIIIEGGGLYDKKKTEYLQKTSTHHEWVPGFTMFKDGQTTLFSPELNNL